MKTGINCQSNCLFNICLEHRSSFEVNNEQQNKSQTKRNRKEKISLKQKNQRRKSDTRLSKKQYKKPSEQQTSSQTYHLKSLKGSFKEENSTSYGDNRLGFGSFNEQDHNLIRPIKYKQKSKKLKGSQSHYFNLIFSEKTGQDYYRIKSFTQLGFKQQQKQKIRLSQQFLISIRNPQKQFNSRLDTITNKQRKKTYLYEEKKKLKELEKKMQKSRNVHNEYETITSLFYSSDLEERISQSTVHIDFFNPSERTISRLASHGQIDSIIIIEK